jgi:hypothetical protein
VDSRTTTASVRIRLATLATVVALVGSACAAGEIGEVLDIFGESDLSQSEDPGTRASGETVVQVLSAREAEDNLERGLTDNDPDAIAQAGTLRPFDPRYPMREAVLREANRAGDLPGWEAMIRAMGLISALNPGRSPSELKRLAYEMYLDALRDAIYVSPAPTARERMLTSYCEGISSKYVNRYASEFPLETTIYVATVDRSLCN